MASVRIYAITLLFLSWSTGGFALLAFGMLRSRRNPIMRMFGYIVAVFAVGFAVGWIRTAFTLTLEDISKQEWSAWQAVVIVIYLALLGGVWHAAFYLLGVTWKIGKTAPAGEGKQQ